MSVFKDSEKYNIRPIAPSDGTDLSKLEFRGLMLAVDGDVSINPIGETTSVVLSLIAGVEYHFGFDKVNATATTATGIVGLL